MEYRTIEVTVMCAKDLKNVNLFTKMDVYVMGSIPSDPKSVQKSPVHKKGGSDPVWNHRFKFNINESDIKLNRVGLVFRIVSKRTLGDREIGRVYVPMKELYDNDITGKDNSGEVSGQERFVTYSVQTKSGKFKGSLEFSYKFAEKYVNRKVEPVTAYPAWSGPGQSSYPVQGQPARVYPPPPPQGNGYGYGYGYGYPTQQQAGYGYGYGYPGQAPARRGNGLGMGGAALGVGAGLLGGFMLGEMVEDIGGGGGMMDDGDMFDW